MKKLGIALGAGGARGIAHVGFLQALEEEGIRPDYITGCSMGSIVGAAYAMGRSVQELKTAVERLRLLDFLGRSKQKGGVFGTQKVRNILTRVIGDKQFSETVIPFRCVATDMISQESIEFSEGSVLDAVIASSAIPGVFPPQERDGRRLIDGVVLERVPAARLKEMGADVIVAVDVLGWLEGSEDVPGLIGVLLESFDIANNRVTQEYREKYAENIDFWLEPQLGKMSQYSLKDAQFAYQKGYELGKEYAPAIKKALGPKTIKHRIMALKNKFHGN